MATTNDPDADGNKGDSTPADTPLAAAGAAPAAPVEPAKQGPTAPTASGDTSGDGKANVANGGGTSGPSTDGNPADADKPSQDDKDGGESGNGNGSKPFILSGPIRQVVPDSLDLKLAPLQRSGVYLAWCVLIMILIFGLTLLYAIFRVELKNPPAEVAVATELLKGAVAQAQAKAASAPGSLSAEDIKPVSDLVSQIATLRRASRDYWHSLAQMLLLNLLLPVLTAILGYVFGRRSEGN